MTSVPAPPPHRPPPSMALASAAASVKTKAVPQTEIAQLGKHNNHSVLENSSFVFTPSVLASVVPFWPRPVDPPLATIALTSKIQVIPPATQPQVLANMMFTR